MIEGLRGFGIRGDCGDGAVVVASGIAEKVDDVASVVKLSGHFVGFACILLQTSNADELAKLTGNPLVCCQKKIQVLHASTTR